MKKLYRGIIMLLLVLSVMLLSSCAFMDAFMNPEPGTETTVTEEDIREFNNGFFTAINGFNSGISVSLEGTSTVLDKLGEILGSGELILNGSKNNASSDNVSLEMKDNIMHLVDGDEEKIIKFYPDGAAVLTMTDDGIKTEVYEFPTVISALKQAIISTDELSATNELGKYEISAEHLSELFAKLLSFNNDESLKGAAENYTFILDATEYLSKFKVSVNCINKHLDSDTTRIDIRFADFHLGSGTLKIECVSPEGTVDYKLDLMFDDWSLISMSSQKKNETTTFTLSGTELAVVKKENSEVAVKLQLAANENGGFDFTLASTKGNKIDVFATLEKKNEGEFDVLFVETEDGVETTGSAGLVFSDSASIELDGKSVLYLTRADNYFNYFDESYATLIEFEKNALKYFEYKVGSIKRGEVPTEFYYLDDKGIMYVVELKLINSALECEAGVRLDHEEFEYFMAQADLAFTSYTEGGIYLDVKSVYDKASAYNSLILDKYSYNKSVKLYVYEYFEESGLYIIVNMASKYDFFYTEDISTLTVADGFVHELKTLSQSEYLIHTLKSPTYDAKCYQYIGCEHCDMELKSIDPVHTFETTTLREQSSDADKVVLDSCVKCTSKEMHIGDNLHLKLENPSLNTLKLYVNPSLNKDSDLSPYSVYYTIEKVWADTEVDGMVLDIPQLTDGTTIIGINLARSMASEADGYFEKVVLPDGMIFVGTNAFRSDSIKSLYLPSTIKVIDSFAFYYCGIETMSSLPTSLEMIGAQSFECCLFESVTIPSGVKSVARAFDNNPNLKTFIINATSLDSFNGINGCNNLETFEINGTVRSMKGVSSPKITELIVPSGTEMISDFKNNPYIERIVLPDTVTYIGERAFMGCTALREIVIGKGVTEIGRQAFENTPSLTEISLPATLARLYPTTFDGCSLTSIYYDGTRSAWDALEVTLPEGITLTTK